MAMNPGLVYGGDPTQARRTLTIAWRDGEPPTSA